MILGVNSGQSHLAYKMRTLGPETWVEVRTANAKKSYVSTTQGQKTINFGNAVETGEPLHADP